MRLKLLAMALVSALATASAAIAGDHPGKGPKPKTGAGCRPAVTVMLAGVLAADVDPQDGDTSFVLTVKRSNKHGRAYKQAGTATVLVDAKTRIRREGARNLGALAPNDRVHVTAKVCKADLKNGGLPDLAARKVGAHPAASADDQSGSGSSDDQPASS